MQRNILNSLFVLILAGVFFSCKAKRAIIKEPPVKEPVAVNSSKAEMLGHIVSAQPDFSTLSIRSKANLEIDNKSYDVSMNIRIRKDQLIWVSVTAIAGIEVARALISPDSIKILNRIQGIYTNKPFSYIGQFSNPQINFKTLQALLLGSCIPEFIDEKSEIMQDSSQVRLSGAVNRLAYSVIFNQLFNVKQTSLRDDTANQMLQADYSSIGQESTIIVPHSVKISSNSGNKSIKLGLEYNKIDVNQQLDFPFTVSKKYTDN